MTQFECASLRIESARTGASQDGCLGPGVSGQAETLDIILMIIFFTLRKHGGVVRARINLMWHLLPVLFGLGLMPFFAHATTFVATPFPDLVKGAPTVARGKIGDSSTDWVSGDDSSKKIFTFYQLEIEEVFKGEVAPGNITIREMGGEKDGKGMQVAGAAQFARGEDVVVFLGEQNRDGSYDVRGLSSGKFDLKRQQDGKLCLSGVGLARAGSDGFVHAHENGEDHGDAPTDCAWNVDSLRQLVRDQGDATRNPLNSNVPSSDTAVKNPATSHAITLPSAAPQLQPSLPEETRPGARGQVWILVLALGLAGLLAILLIKPKR